ncbi:MAG: LysR family transcriptional regulator [Fibrobacter sp.]|nr:LysR family transcriptional regulator [Fibrobacter sp.]
MELTQLKYFIEVARTEHVTQSAKNLCIVQPALTQAIHKLEDELGVALFKTSGRNIKLTESGKFFYDKVLPLYENMVALPELLRSTAEKQNNNVMLNVLAASTLITNAVIEYKQDNSEINVDLVQNEETGAFDICIRTYATYKPELDNINSDETRVYCEKIYLAVPNTAKYKKVESISLFDLKEEKFISLYGSKKYREICNTLCNRIGFHPNVTFESDNAAAIKEAVAAGIGVSFWPELSWGKMDHKKVKLLAITNTEFKRDIVLSIRRNKQDNSKTEQFFDFLNRYIQRRQARRQRTI